MKKKKKRENSTQELMLPLGVRFIDSEGNG